MFGGVLNNDGVWVRLLLLVVSFLFVIACSDDCKREMPKLTGNYLGYSVSADSAEIFAPGIINRGLRTRDVAITPDLNEIYFSVIAAGNNYPVIVCVKRVDGVWSEPQVPEFAKNLRHKYIEPAISHDGKKFFFVSNMGNGGNTSNDMDIYVMNRIDDHWGEPKNIGAPINSELGEFFPSITNDGTLYFSRDLPDRTSKVYRSRLIDGVYEEPIQLGPAVNAGRSTFNAYIARDESYIITPTFGMEDSFGATDYYISFRSEDDTWRGPYNMGPKVNSASGQEWSAYVSPDNKYLFYMSDKLSGEIGEGYENATFTDLINIHNQPGNGLSNIYWIKADVIEELRDSLSRL